MRPDRLPITRALGLEASDTRLQRVALALIYRGKVAEAIDGLALLLTEASDE